MVMESTRHVKAIQYCTMLEEFAAHTILQSGRNCNELVLCTSFEAAKMVIAIGIDRSESRIDAICQLLRCRLGAESGFVLS